MGERDQKPFLVKGIEKQICQRAAYPVLRGKIKQRKIEQSQNPNKILMRGGADSLTRQRASRSGGPKIVRRLEKQKRTEKTI